MCSKVRVRQGSCLPVSLAWLGGGSPWSLRNLRLKSPEKDTFSLLPLMLLFLSCSMTHTHLPGSLRSCMGHGPLGPARQGLQLEHELRGQIGAGLGFNVEEPGMAFILARPKTRWGFSHGQAGLRGRSYPVTSPIGFPPPLILWGPAVSSSGHMEAPWQEQGADAPHSRTC